MYNSYEFTYGNESSYQYGLMIYEIDGTGQSPVSFGNTASVVETRLNNRIQPVHFGVNYHTKPLEFKLVFGTDRQLDRYEMEAVALWLTGRQHYDWMTIDQPDLARVQFRCLITNLTPIHHGWLPVAFEATVRCDCPYAYGYPFEKVYPIKGETSILFRNDSSTWEYVKPNLTIVPNAGTTEFSIVNESDGGREFKLSDIPAAGVNIHVNNVNGIIQEATYGYNLYGGFNLNFFRLVRGDNLLKVTGDGVLTISGRLLYNVAG